VRVCLLCAAIVGLAACSGGNSGAVRELMKSPITPASDAIFNAVAYTNGRLVAAPQDDAAWSRLREQAQSLNQSADRLITLAPARDKTEWVKQSAALKASASDVERAVEHRDLDQILAAGGNVYSTCTNCHAAYIAD
jgi:cytochrome c556